ncbi:hypothetical protein GCM10027419_18000 [Pandoraea terrae]
MLLAVVASSFPLAANAQDLSADMVRYSGAEYDGVWSGHGTVSRGNNCTPNPSLKFTVKGGRILTNGSTQGAYFGAGASKVVGVILQDKTIDLTLLDKNGRGRDSQAYGAIAGDSEIRLNDPGENCSYVYTLTKAEK